MTVKTKRLHTIGGPEDLKKCSVEEMKEVAQDIRDVIIDVLPRTGGHLASNLGVVELTIALHYVYNLPLDQLVFDVGHQCYPHKLLTGRLKSFETLRQKGGMSGFPNPWESEYDNFYTGHAGTAVSMALGLAMGYKRLGKDRHVAAIVGDGSFCGLTFEALNHLGSLKKNMTVILNDNKMAISPTVGALSKYLNRIRTDDYYKYIIEEIKRGVNKLPMLGESLDQLGQKVLSSLEKNFLHGQFFRELGMRYYGPVDGHDLGELIAVLHKIRDFRGPVLLHVITQKGLGHPLAEKDPLKYYACSKPSAKPAKPTKPTRKYSQCFAEALARASKSDDRIMAITAAMAQGTMLDTFMRDRPDRAVDTGIAEAHAITLASGLEVAGMKPVVVIYSSFLQRAYDSVMHDICLQKGLSTVMAIDRAGLVGDDGPSHHGVFDVAYLRHLPRMIVAAPRDGEELEAMLEWALRQTAPVALRYPRGDAPALEYQNRTEIELGSPEILEKGERVAILAYGAMVEQAAAAVKILKENGIHPTLVNLRFVKPLSADKLRPILESHTLVVTVEDHVLMGGVGSALLELIQEHEITTGRIVRLGVPDRFITFAERLELLEMLELDGPGIARRILQENGVRQLVLDGGAVRP